MTDARDALAELIDNAAHVDDPYRAADAILAAGWTPPSDTVVDLGFVFGEPLDE